MSCKENVSINMDKRIIYLSEDINNETIGYINFNLLFMIHEDSEKEKEIIGYERQPIHIYINSCGGTTYDMWSLIDIIVNSKTPIYTYCTGYALSAAFCIFLAGHERFATEHSTFMYHQLSSNCSGKFQDLNEAQEELVWIQDKMEEFVESRTNIDKKILEESKKCKKDLYFHIEEALEKGIVTYQLDKKEEKDDGV